LYHAIKSLPENSSERKQRIGVYSNYDEIASIVLSQPDDYIFEECGPLELFPRDWRTREDPTAGFDLLCRILSMHIAPIALAIRGQPQRVVSIIVEEPDFSIYHIKLNGADYVAKKASMTADGSRARWKHAADNVRAEIRKLSILNDIEALKPYILEPLWELTSLHEAVLVSPLGKDLVAWWVSNITDEHPDIHQRMNLFGNLIKDAVRGIAILHQNGWVHTDIRPKNIIVYNNTARLIDWVTAYQLRMGGDHYQGEIDPFAHDSLYEICNEPKAEQTEQRREAFIQLLRT
jgi:hypothetical protein